MSEGDTPLSEIISREPVKPVMEAENLTVETVVEELEPVKQEPVIETEEDAPTASDEVPIEKQLAAQIAKAQDERSKRQQLKQELEDLRQQIATQRKPEAPDPYSEPDKALEYVKAELRQEFQGQFLNMSEQSARSRHSEDFDEVTDVFFNDMLRENPALQAQALKQVDPYEFIYKTAKNHLELTQLNESGGVEGYRKKLEQELRAKWEAEQAEARKSEIESAIDKSIPGTLSTKRAAGGNKAEVFTGPTPLSKILGKR